MNVVQEVLIHTHEGGVTELRLNRPAKLNAVTPSMLDELRRAVDAALADDKARCLPITAEGRGFCAGRDLSSASGGEDAEAMLAGQMNPIVAAVHDCPKPTIAAVNGAAMGFGLGLALACDIVLAGSAARFSVPFARLGAALDCGGHYLLRRRLTESRVLQMIYTADPVDGETAARLGLADACHPDAELHAAALELARRCAAGPALAFRRQKALLRAAGSMSLQDVLAAEARLQGELALTDDYREGIQAFQQRRPPVFAQP